MATKAAQGRARRREGRPTTRSQQAYAGYVYGDSTCGQRAVYELGLTGIPVFNVNNNCSTGSTALMLGAQAVEGGIAECVLVVGFEQMEKPARSGRSATDRANPLDKHANVMNEVQGFNAGAARRADVRRRRPRVPLEVRHEARDVRARSARRRASTRRRTRTRSSTSRCSRRGDHGVARGVRSADALPVLPADVRRRRGGALLATSSRRSTGITKPGVHRRAGDDDRLPVELRGALDDQDGRLRHGEDAPRRRSTSRPASAPRTSTSSSSTTASPRTSSSPTRRSASARKARPRSSSGTATTPTAASSSRTRRAACSRRATRSARPASRSAPSSCGSSAARPTSARSRARRSRSSTTSASAARAS